MSFQPSAYTSMTFSAASANVGVLPPRGSLPLSMARRFSNAAWRASASVTSGYLPRPMLVTFPLIRTRCDHVFDTRSFAMLRTSRLSPYPPRPSP